MTNAATDCTVCEQNDRYNDESGYHCFQINPQTVACTCPNKTYKLNHRCRICDLPDICGDNPKNICAELGDVVNEFACFCVDGSNTYGEPCKPTITKP